MGIGWFSDFTNDWHGKAWLWFVTKCRPDSWQFFFHRLRTGFTIVRMKLL